jgi:DNA-binding response OmpR family regulator
MIPNMEKLFDKILDQRFRVDLDSVEITLSNLGYKIGKDEYRVLATKYKKGYRLNDTDEPY